MSAFVAPWKAELIASNQRSAKPMVCPRCDVDVWTGLDDDVCAMSAIAEAEPVSVEDGFRAVLDGLTIYSLTASMGGKQLWRRDEWNYGETRWPCLRQHRCPASDTPAERPQETRRAEPRQPAPVSRRVQRQAAKAEREAATAARIATPTRRRRAS